MYENLLSRDPQTGALDSLLAERWEVLEGGRVWRFHLRQGVPFHNGHGEVTAKDVKFTFEAIAKDGSANALAPEFRQITRMDIDDPYTITIRFDQPFVTFGNRVTPGLFASVAYIQSKQYIETVGEEGAERHPVGTGSWKFVEHGRGDRIVYEAVEQHWRAVPHFKRLVFLKVPEPATRLAMLRAGSVDVIEIGGEYVEELKKVGIRTLVIPNAAWVWVVLGGRWPTRPTYDPTVPWAVPEAERAHKVRLALNLAVDKQAIIQQILGGLGTATGTVNFYPTDLWTTEALATPYPYDPEPAKALRVKAECPKSFAVTMHLRAWPGRSFLPESAKRWHRLGADWSQYRLAAGGPGGVCADSRARTYPGVALAYAGPVDCPRTLGAAQALHAYAGCGATARRAPDAGCSRRSVRRGRQTRA